jgi:hypothetical protein
MTVALSGANGVFWALVGLAVFIALVVAWRVTIHDRAVSRVRFGVFYERERDDDYDEDEPESETVYSSGGKADA